MRSDARPSSSPLLSLLNVAGLCGWASVLLLLALHPTPTPTLLRITLGSELLCTLEVSLIAIGVLCEPAEEEWGANAGVVCVRSRGGGGLIDRSSRPLPVAPPSPQQPMRSCLSAGTRMPKV